MRLERIGNIAQFINGAPFKPEDWCENGMKIIRIQNLTDPNKPYNKTNRIVDKKYIVTKGDVLVSWSATIDVFTWEDEDALLNQHIFKVIFDKSKVDKSYFIIALRETINELTKFAHGATMKHVVKGDFDNHKIPLPPIPVQLHIANILSKAENLITQRKQSIALLDEFLKSTFLEMFGDPVKNEKEWKNILLGEVLTVKHGFAFKSEFFSTFGEYILLTPGNFYEEGGFKNRGEKQKYYTGSFPSEYLLKEGDLLIAMTEQAPGLLGSPIVVPHSNVFLHNQRLGLVLFDEKILSNRFLFHLFNFYKIRSLIHSKATGTKVRHTSPTKIQEIIVAIPPIELQTQFAQIVEKTETLKAHYQSSLQELDNLYGSISQRAFRGELKLNQAEEQVLMAAEPEKVYQKQ